MTILAPVSTATARAALHSSLACQCQTGKSGSPLGLSGFNPIQTHDGSERLRISRRHPALQATETRRKQHLNGPNGAVWLQGPMETRHTCNCKPRPRYWSQRLSGVHWTRGAKPILACPAWPTAHWRRPAHVSGPEWRRNTRLTHCRLDGAPAAAQHPLIHLRSCSSQGRANSA